MNDTMNPISRCVCVSADGRLVEIHFKHNTGGGKRLNRPRGYSPVVCHKALAQAELAENVHHDLHRRVIGNGEGAHVQNAAELQWPRTVCGEGRGMLGKIDPRVQHYSLLLTAGVF